MNLSDEVLEGGWEAYAAASVAACHSKNKLVGLPSLAASGGDAAPGDWAESLVDAVVVHATCIAPVKDVCDELAERTGLEPKRIETVLTAWGHDGLLRINGNVVAICPSKVSNRRARAVFSARSAGASPLLDA